jgi:hypothetical protein
MLIMTAAEQMKRRTPPAQNSSRDIDDTNDNQQGGNP